MPFIKWLCLVGTLIGLLLTILATFIIQKPYDLVLSVAGSIFVTFGTYFFAHLKQDEKAERIKQEYEKEIALLRSQYEAKIKDLTATLETTGQEYLIKQYAGDTIETALIHSVVMDIRELTNENNVNIIAIRQTLKSIDMLQAKGMLSKTSELLNMRGGRSLLTKYLHHLERISSTNAQVPDKLKETITLYKRLLDQARAKSLSAPETS